MNIKTVLFDLDGTLIDTNELIYVSFKYTFDKYGYSFSREEILEFNGPPLIETFMNVNPEKADDMLKTYREHNFQHHNDLVTVFPNVIETLESLRENGIKMGIVSTKMRNGVELGLEVTKLKHFFDSIVSLDDVQNAKPHPEPVLKGMKELKGSPETTIMIGDNYQDIESGKNAGVKTAGVAWSLKGVDVLKRHDPTYILNDMQDLDRKSTRLNSSHVAIS